jgi:uncharacterized protein YjaG (DUF416 family)
MYGCNLYLRVNIYRRLGKLGRPWTDLTFLDDLCEAGDGYMPSAASHNWTVQTVQYSKVKTCSERHIGSDIGLAEKGRC